MALNNIKKKIPITRSCDAASQNHVIRITIYCDGCGENY